MTDPTALLLASADRTIAAVAAQYRRHAPADVGVEDLMQAGRLAAMRAAQTYDPSRGAAFSTYVVMPVRSACRQLCSRNRERAVLNAPLKDDGDTTMLDTIPAAEDAALDIEGLERDALVRKIVKRVIAKYRDHARAELVVELVERLQDTKVLPSGAVRSPTSFAELAEKYGISAQSVNALHFKVVHSLRCEADDEDLSVC